MEQLFKFNEKQVRTIIQDNEIWFAGIDIARALEYSKPSDAIMKLDDDERKLTPVAVESGQKRKTWIINESGMYSLILTSSKSESKQFKKWITHHVLPEIRKAGFYGNQLFKARESRIQAIIKTRHDKETRLNELKTKIKDLDSEIKALNAELNETLTTNPTQLKLLFDD